jgi:putative ABC transport system permease protein
MWLIKLAFRNARRNVRRSILTAGTVIIGVAMFVLFASFIGGMSSQMFDETTQHIGQIRVADTDYLARETLRPLYEYIPDADAVVAVAEGTPGVTGAFARVQSGVAVSAGDELGDVFGMATGAEPGWYERIGLYDKLVEGRAPEGPNEWMLGSKLVKKADAKLGDEIILFGQTQDGSLSPAKGTLVGIVHAGTALVDRGVYLPLDEMQNIVDIEAGAIEVLVYTEDLHDAAAVADRIAERVDADPALTGLSVQSWTNRAPYNAMIPMMGAISGVLASALVFLTSLAIWNTMTMSVMERTAEIGVMRSMGLSAFGAVSMFVVEAATIALIGGAVGVGLGAIPSYYMETVGMTMGDGIADSMGTTYAIRSTIYGDLTWAIALQGLVLGVVMATVGSFIPSLRAAAIQPVEAMRHGR